jgi:hypothetical protein
VGEALEAHGIAHEALHGDEMLAVLNAAGKAAGLVLRPIGQQDFHFNWFAACITLLRNLVA